MKRLRDKILIYKISREERDIITSYYSKEYNVIDASSCFTDILAIPALAIFIDSTKLSSDEWTMMNEVFSYDSDTQIIFTNRPENPLVSEFPYFVEDDIAHSDGEKMGVDEYWELAAGYESALQSKNKLLNDIDAFLTPDDDMSIGDKTLFLVNRCTYFRHWYDLMKHRDVIASRERVAYRMELLNAVLAMKLAYGLIDASDVVPFDTDEDEDSEWILALAETLKQRRTQYLRHGNQYYYPKQKMKGTE